MHRNNSEMKVHKLLFALPLVVMSLGVAQQQPPPSSEAHQPYLPPSVTAAATNASGVPTTPAEAPAGYVLGPGDQISVFVNEISDQFAAKVFRIDSSGDVSLPVIGHLHAAGLTTSELEKAARIGLSHELKDPQVSISIAGFGSQSVSVLGAVTNPGPRQLEGHKTLFEVLSLAGGLRTDAGYMVTVTRDLRWGAIPLPQAVTDPNGKMSVASIKVKAIMTSSNPAENILILPGDTISVPPADLVYAVGCVNKPGAFPLNGHESLSALQVVSLSGGAQKTAALNKAKILRAVSGTTTRTEIPVDLKLLMAGKGPDIPLQPEDILFVPNSGAKSTAYRTLDAIVSAAGFAATRVY
jgi:polysaccharide export outer membrane protein